MVDYVQRPGGGISRSQAQRLISQFGGGGGGAAQITTQHSPGSPAGVSVAPGGSTVLQGWGGVGIQAGATLKLVDPPAVAGVPSAVADLTLTTANVSPDSPTQIGGFEYVVQASPTASPGSGAILVVENPDGTWGIGGYIFVV